MKSIIILFFSSLILANEFSSNIGLTTNYIWRGQTLDNNAPALQGGVDYTHSFKHFSIGIGDWASTTTGTLLSNPENNLYASISREFSKDFTLKAQYTYIQYIQDSNSNYLETSVGSTYVVSPILVLDTMWNYSKTWVYYSFIPTVNLPYDLSFSPSIGYSDVNSEVVGYENYMDYKASLLKSYEDTWEFGLNYSTSNREVEDRSLFFTILRKFN